MVPKNGLTIVDFVVFRNSKSMGATKQPFLFWICHQPFELWYSGFFLLSFGCTDDIGIHTNSISNAEQILFSERINMAAAK